MVSTWIGDHSRVEVDTLVKIPGLGERGPNTDYTNKQKTSSSLSKQIIIKLSYCNRSFGKFHLTRGEGTAAESFTSHEVRGLQRKKPRNDVRLTDRLFIMSGGLLAESVYPPGNLGMICIFPSMGGDTPPELYTFFQGTRCLTCIQGIVILSTAGKQL